MVLSRLDYANSLLFGCSAYNTAKLQRVHSACSQSVVGRRTWPGAVSALPVRPRRRPEVSPSLPPVYRRPIRQRSTTSRRSQNAAQRHVSPSVARSSTLRAVSRILVTTSGEPILLPVSERHLKLNLGQRPLTWCSDSDIPPSSSRTFPAFRTFRVQNDG